MGASWAALGFLEALLGGLWTQKRVKTNGFLRFLKRLFKVHDGPLGPRLSQTVFQNEFQHFLKSGKTNYVKDELKNEQKVGPKMGSRIAHF